MSGMNNERKCGGVISMMCDNTSIGLKLLSISLSGWSS